MWKWEKVLCLIELIHTSVLGNFGEARTVTEAVGHSNSAAFMLPSNQEVMTVCLTLL